jgi:hypothetical protein
MNRWTATIDDWLRTSGMSESGLGFRACANGRAVERIRDGTASVDTLSAVLKYIEENQVEKRKRN